MRVIGSLLIALMLITGVVCAQAQTADPLSDAAAQMAQKFTQAAETKKGQVVAVDNDSIPPTIYVALGTKDGIFKDQLLDVVANGDPIKVGDRITSYKRKPVGTAHVTDVEEEVTIAQMKDLVAGQKPAEGNVASLRTVPGSLAVAMLLRPDGAGCQMGQEFADKLGMALGGSGRFQMVERTRLEALLKELQLSLSDLYNTKNAARFGDLAQASGLLLGSITQRNDGYAISARVVDIQTGVQVATATANCPKTAELDAKYGQTVTGPGGGGTGGGTGFVETGKVTPFAELAPIRTDGDWELYRRQTTAIAGTLWDDGWGLASGVFSRRHGYALYDMGGATDLFECWLGVDDSTYASTTSGLGAVAMGEGRDASPGRLGAVRFASLTAPWGPSVPGAVIAQPPPPMGPGGGGKSGRARADVTLKSGDKVLASFTVRQGDEARFVSCPLTGLRSLEISFSGNPVLCNPRFVKGRTKPAEPTDIYVGDGQVQYIQVPGEYRFHLGARH